MEVKLVQEFDYSDKNSLFGKMDDMNDAIVKDIRENENSLFITLHELKGFLDPDGEIMWPYEELEIEYEFAEEKYLHICVYGKWNTVKFVSLNELFDWLKKKKAELEMSTWLMTAGGGLELDFYAQPIKYRRNFQITKVEINLLPQKIIYRWKA